MQQDRWLTVNQIFDEALELPQGEQRRFVEWAAKGDRELQREVERLLDADELAGDYLEEPVAPEEVFAFAGFAALTPGDVICNRYRIVRPLGEGGMGKVFEALDPELGVNVALKVIRPEIAEAPEALARFRQEVRLALRVTHPNICRTYHFDCDPRESSTPPRPIHFLTMELLAGETLAERIRRDGALPLAEALAIARQLGSALDAAHALGVLHRDIKPGNVMLAPAEEGHPLRAVITDFGLARLDPLLPAGEQAGISQVSSHAYRPVGALAYMPPEQLTGLPVSPATDVYAFGLVLYEMVTGARAFSPANPLSGMTERLTGPPPSARALVPGLPERWEQAIAGCLQVAPAERFGSAREVLDCLEGRGGGRLRPGGRRGSLADSLWARSWGVALVSLVLLAAVSLCAALYRIYKRPPQTAPGATVYLTEVSNQTGEKKLDTLTELLRAGLAQSTQINLLDQGRVGDILQQMTKAPDTRIDAAVARQIAMRAGAARVVFATVRGAGGRYSLDIDVQQPDSRPERYREHWTKSFAWTLSAAQGDTIAPELLDAVRKASDWVRYEAGESAHDIARLDVPPEDVTTSSWEALADYMRALRSKSANKPMDAVLALKDAIHNDSGFALAYGTLADVLSTLHQQEAAFEAYKQALDPMLERRLSRRERDRLRGMYAIDSWDYATAVDAFRDYQSFYPSDPYAWLYPTYPLKMLGRDEEAIGDLKRVPESAYSREFVMTALASEYVMTGDLAEAKRLVASAHSDDAVVLSASISFLEEHYDEAGRLLASITRSENMRERSRGWERVADLLAERGDYREAIEELNRGIEDDRAHGYGQAQAGKWIARAWMEAKLGEFQACSGDLRQAIEVDASPEMLLAAESVLGQAIQLAPSHASGRLRAQMVAIARDRPRQDYGMISQILALRTRGEGLLAAGNVEAAVAVFRHLAAVDAPVGSREYLGRALLVAAAVELDRRKAAALRREAMDAYGRVALRPAVVWQYDSYAYPPGFFADELEAWLTLAAESAVSEPGIAKARRRLNGLRGQGFDRQSVLLHAVHPAAVHAAIPQSKERK